jgi:undecaprenyl phosphate-alpha-L-ara4N flippase subunit ArnE
MIELAIVAAMVLAACAGNMLLKLGADASRFQGSAPLLDLRLLIGAGLFGCALLFYVLLLKRVPLNVAQSFMALQFVGVILASYVFLQEPLPALRIVGVALIACGVILVGYSSSSPA